jgi:hypothetical protein
MENGNNAEYWEYLCSFDKELG